MPELPEVETIVRQLDKVLPGQKIERVEVLRKKSFVGNKDELIGLTVDSVGRRAKMIVVKCHSATVTQMLVIHLKMTGQLIYLSGTHRVVGGHPTPDWVSDLPGKSTRVIFDFAGAAKLFFNDLRVFGWVKLVSDSEWQKMTDKLPPDVTDKEFSREYFTAVLAKSGRPVKLTLMDQTKFGGVGNIYANDALYLAKISPKRKVRELKPAEINRLYLAIKKVIDLGIKYGGASVDKYVNAAGVGGKYQEHFLVYNRENQMCKRCGSKIKKIRLGGRGTYYCPLCQKED